MLSNFRYKYFSFTDFFVKTFICDFQQFYLMPSLLNMDISNFFNASQGLKYISNRYLCVTHIILPRIYSNLLHLINSPKSNFEYVVNFSQEYKYWTLNFKCDEILYCSGSHVTTVINSRGIIMGLTIETAFWDSISV